MSHARTASLLALMFTVSGSHAQVGRVVHYDISHDFRLIAPQADTARVLFGDFRHAWIRTNGLETEQHDPPAQQPAFDPYGNEHFGLHGMAFNSGLFGGSVPVQYLTGVIPPTGSPGAAVCLDRVLLASRARACNVLRVDPWVNQAPIDISGRIQSYGYADAAVQGSGAAFVYAFSTAWVRIDSGVTLASGQIQWQIGALVDSVGGGAGSSAIKDPVILTAVNTSTGEVVEHTLVDVDMRHDGPGRVEFTPGTLTVDIPTFELILSVHPGIIGPGQDGTLIIEVDQGVVQNALGSGLYAGSAPAPGTTVPFTVPMPGIVLDYDLNLDPTQPWEVSAEMGGGGGADASAGAPPCAADINGDGVLNFFDVAEFMALFLEQHPAADFNGDGAFDFFDIALFLGAFQAGCADQPG